MIEMRTGVGRAVTGGRLSRVVVDALRDRLLAGDFAAGDPLSVEELRQELGVSKQPVMEAVRLLAADGLVEVVPQVGCRVTSYTSREAADFFRMFARFEAVIAETAAQRALPKDVAALEEFAASMHQVELRGDPSERHRLYMAGNRGFHSRIHAMADSPLMASTSSRLWDLSDFLIATVGPRGLMAPVVDTRNHEHDEIVAALSAGDGPAAGAAMHQHIVGVVELLGGQER